MTLVRIVSIALFLLLAGGSIAVYRHLRRTVKAANGVGSINEDGLDGSNDDGICVGSVGASREADSSS